MSRLGYRLASSALLLAAVLAGLAVLGTLAFAVWILWSDRQAEPLAHAFARLDLVDGVADGSLIPDALRSALGFAPSASPREKPRKPVDPKPGQRERR